MRSQRTGGLPGVLNVTIAVALTAAACAIQSRGTTASANGALMSTAARSSATTQSGTLWLIFLDDLHVDFRSTGYLRALLRTVVDGLVQVGDVVGSVSTGPSSISIDLTDDRQRILNGIGKATGSAMAPADIFRVSQQNSTQPDEVLYRVAVSVSTAFDVVARLGKVKHPRKAFIYVSSGYYIDLPPDGRVMGSNAGLVAPRPLFKDLTVAGVRNDLFSLMDESSRSNVKVFAVDSRRLANPTQPDSSTDRIWWQNYWATTRNSLRVMSERTGGFALFEEQDLVEGLQRINSTVRN